MRRWRWPPKAFANLRAYLEWYADDGETTPCCGFAAVSIEEIRAEPRHFDCARCAHAHWDDALWAVNRRALDIHTRLCGRTTADLGLAGWLLQELTQGWAAPEILDLVARLELIRSVLDPPKST